MTPNRNPGASIDDVATREDRVQSVTSRHWDAATQNELRIGFIVIPLWVNVVLNAALPWLLFETSKDLPKWGGPASLHREMIGTAVLLPLLTAWICGRILSRRSRETSGGPLPGRARKDVAAETESGPSESSMRGLSRWLSVLFFPRIEDALPHRPRTASQRTANRGSANRGRDRENGQKGQSFVRRLFLKWMGTTRTVAIKLAGSGGWSGGVCFALPCGLLIYASGLLLTATYPGDGVSVFAMAVIKAIFAGLHGLWVTPLYAFAVLVCIAEERERVASRI
ncbi:MAG: hypothetical protein AAF958_03710 [Planctomycetota bacterium]